MILGAGHQAGLPPNCKGTWNKPHPSNLNNRLSYLYCTMTDINQMINPFQAIIERLNGIEAAIRQFREHVAGPATPLPEIGGIELAEAVTGLSRSTLYNLTSAHQIPFYKKAKKLYFKRSELERYVLENKVYSQDELRNELRLGKGPR